MVLNIVIYIALLSINFIAIKACEKSIFIWVIAVPLYSTFRIINDVAYQHKNKIVFKKDIIILRWLLLDLLYNATKLIIHAWNPARRVPRIRKALYLLLRSLQGIWKALTSLLSL